MFYVIDIRKGYVTHESKFSEECERYIHNASELFGGSFKIVNGAKARDEFMKGLRSSER